MQHRGEEPNMSDTSLPQPFPCTECQAGMMHLRYITYFTWLSDELITVPNFPAWICDFCGRREYDERAISWLTMLLNPNAGKPSSANYTQRPSAHKRDSDRRQPTTK
jgi:YgiT-type zinc finger domain-containing protein